MSQVIIIGASGHAQVCLEILEAQGLEVIGFYDDDPKLAGTTLHGYPILGKISQSMPELNDNNREYIVAIGNNEDRRNIVASLKIICNKDPINAIHPSAIISERTKIGVGNFIAAGVIINTGTLLGDYVIVNTGATLDHDNHIKDFAQISPGCNLAGNVTIEESVFIGTGAIIIPGKTIGRHAIIGAGAVVISNIPPFSTAVGVPARVIKQHNPKPFQSR
jgi:sugar O-acyltransferase (sialic acid O-acetyltransferase NeuD family)